MKKRNIYLFLILLLIFSGVYFITLLEKEKLSFFNKKDVEKSEEIVYEQVKPLEDPGKAYLFDANCFLPAKDVEYAKERILNNCPFYVFDNNRENIQKLEQPIGTVILKYEDATFVLFVREEFFEKSQISLGSGEDADIYAREYIGENAQIVIPVQIGDKYYEGKVFTSIICPKGDKTNCDNTAWGVSVLTPEGFWMDILGSKITEIFDNKVKEPILVRL